MDSQTLEMIILAITCTGEKMEMKFLFINLIPNSHSLHSPSSWPGTRVIVVDLISSNHSCFPWFPGCVMSAPPRVQPSRRSSSLPFGMGCTRAITWLFSREWWWRWQRELWVWVPSHPAVLVTWPGVKGPVSLLPTGQPCSFGRVSAASWLGGAPGMRVECASRAARSAHLRGRPGPQRPPHHVPRCHRIFGRIAENWVK